MKVRQVLDEANTLAEENLDEETTLQFLNQATAEINTRAKADFPFYDMTQLDEEMVLPEKWVRRLYIPFVVGRIKQMDSSQVEYTDLFTQFEAGMRDFIAYYVIPEQYRDRSSEGYTDPDTGEFVEYGPDIYTTPPLPWWRW